MRSIFRNESLLLLYLFIAYYIIKSKMELNLFWIAFNFEFISFILSCIILYIIISFFDDHFNSKSFLLSSSFLFLINSFKIYVKSY